MTKDCKLGIWKVWEIEKWRTLQNAQAYLVNHVQLPAAAAEDKTEMLVSKTTPIHQVCSIHLTILHSAIVAWKKERRFILRILHTRRRRSLGVRPTSLSHTSTTFCSPHESCPCGDQTGATATAREPETARWRANLKSPKFLFGGVGSSHYYIRLSFGKHASSRMLLRASSYVP